MFLAPAIGLLLLLVIIPLANLGWTSMTNASIFGSDRTQYIGLENYANLLDCEDFLVVRSCREDSFWHALYNTISMALASTAISVGLGIGVAFIFSYDTAIIRALRSFLLAPFIAGPVVVALTASIVLNPQISPLFESPPLAVPNTAQIWLVVVDVWHWLPLVAWILMLAIQRIPHSAFEAARLDTNSNATIFRWIAIPQMRDAILLVSLLRLLTAIRMFEIPFVLTRGGPGTATSTSALDTYTSAFLVFRTGEAAARGVILTIVCLAVGIIFVWLMTRRSADKSRDYSTHPSDELFALLKETKYDGNR